MSGAGDTFNIGEVHLEVLETSDAAFVMRATHQPDTPFPPAHLHPNQTETFTVERGRLLFVLDGEERSAAAGDVVVVPPGVVHQVRNPEHTMAVVHWATSPALRTGDLFACLDRAQHADDGGTSLFACMAAHGDEFRLAGTR